MQVGVMDLSMEVKKLMEMDFMKGDASLKMQESQQVSSFSPTKLLGNDFDNDKPIHKLLTPDDIPEDIWALLNEIEDCPSQDSWSKQDGKKSVTCSVSSTLASEATEHKPMKTETSQITLGLRENELHQDARASTYPAHDTAQSTDLDVFSLSDLPTPSVFLPSANDCKNSPMLFPNFELPLDVSTPDVDVGFLMSNSADLFVPPVPESTVAPQVTKEEKVATIQEQLLQDILPSQDPEPPKQDPEVTTSPSSNLLTLTIGNSNQVLVGNGAKLQLRRRASNAFNYTQENAVVDGAAAAAPTIIITVVDNTNCQSFIANSDNKDISVQGDSFVSSAKKMCMSSNLREDEMRRKNNEASRKSRLSRKNREKDMVKLAGKLEEENKKLHAKVEHLTKLRETVKSQLINLLKSK